MKKGLKICLVLICLIIVKLLFTFSINEVIIANYKNDKYNTSLIKSLYFINYPESYIAYYNHGNLLYKSGNYSEAIDKYEISLEKNPPQKRVCDIRINLSLSITATINYNDKDDALTKLKKARTLLYKDNCAHENDDNGDSKEAEELESELKKLEEELNNSEENNNNNNNNKENNENNNSQDEKTIEEKLKEIQKDSNASRQQENDSDENVLTYYDGKSW